MGSTGQDVIISTVGYQTVQLSPLRFDLSWLYLLQLKSVCGILILHFKSNYKQLLVYNTDLHLIK